MEAGARVAPEAHLPAVAGRRRRRRRRRRIHEVDPIACVDEYMGDWAWAGAGLHVNVVLIDCS